VCSFNSVVRLLAVFFSFLQEKDFWKTELKEFSAKNGYDLNRNRDSPLLLDVLEGFLKLEVFQSAAFIVFFFPSVLLFCADLSR